MVRPSFGKDENKKPKKEKPPKKDKKEADAPPPLFTHHNNNELLRGHKSPQQRKSSKVKINVNLMEIPAFGGPGGSGSGSKDESEFYEEEVVEESEYYEEEIIEEEVVDDNKAAKPVLPEIPPRDTTIRFEEFDEMMTVLHINDYTNHEISKTWFKRDEYTNMSNLARKTVNKAEERLKEIEKSKTKKGHKVIECRGLEAWTTEGAAATKQLKERAIEAVFYEQCRQWDTGVTDLDKIREVYREVSVGAQQIANDRATSDETIVQQLLAKEKAELEEKLNKTQSKKSKLVKGTKALVGKTAKKTAGGVAKTAKLTSKVTKKTGKVALGTAVATATLDRKMLKETVKSIPKKKKRECEHQIVHTPSQSSQATNPQTSADQGRLIPVLVTDSDDDDDNTSSRYLDPSVGMYMDQSSKRENHNNDMDASDMARISDTSVEAKKKKKKLKLLGVAPIPGTKKEYKQDRRKKKIEKRQKSKNSNLPAWEQAQLSSGKY